MYTENQGASCGRCAEEIGLATVLSPKLERVSLSTSAGWDRWHQELAGLLDSVSPAPLAEFVTRVCRDLMEVEAHEIAATGFLVDEPCASCDWGEE